jgi:hypothetical protein
VGRILRAAPLVLCVLLLGFFRVPAAGERALVNFRSYREHGTIDGSTSESARALSALCAAIREPGLVASVEPWNVVLRCGQASVRTPPDLVNAEWRARFIESERIRYFHGDQSPVNQWLAESPALRRIAGAGRYALYEVRDPTPEERAWSPPPALACAGRESECPHPPPAATPLR